VLQPRATDRASLPRLAVLVVGHESLRIRRRTSSFCNREFGAARSELGSFAASAAPLRSTACFARAAATAIAARTAEDCEATTGSGHCLRCVGCHDCSHCEDAVGCTHSAYLLRCSFCTDCKLLLRLRGLGKKEFHILNRPYARSEYFALLKSLRGR